MNRRAVGAFAAVLLASLGTFVLLAYVRSAEDRALAGEQVVDVFIVQQDIASGTPGEALEGLVALKKVPAKVEAPDSVDDLAALAGKVATVDLVPGEQLLSVRFAPPEALAQGGVEVPEGLHQVSIAMEPQRALGGNIKAGDTVGVLASFDPFEGDDPPGDEPPPRSPNSTHMILHKVLVTDVQNGAASTDSEGTQSAPATGAVMVTLAVDAPAVERIVFAAEHGFVWLSHEPESAPEDGTSVQTRGSIYE